MNAHCPKCGGVAKFVSQTAISIDFADLEFKCVDPKCGSEIVAEIKFSLRKAPAPHCFSSGSERVDHNVKTDC